ncbi:MAG: hypothetical protein V4579_05480 [Pseudomonadota bacterium]
MSTLARRALVFVPLILLFALLSVFPQRYRAAATLSPTDPSSLGLSGTLGQLGAINSVFGNQAAIEVALKVGNGIAVRNLVITRVGLERRLGKSRVEAHRWLEDEVTVRSLRGGIIVIEMKLRDGELAKTIVEAYTSSTQEQLGQISRRQTSYKRNILVQLANETSDNLARAQANYDAFRLRNLAPNPMTEVDVVTQRIAQLQGAIKARQVAMNAALQIYTPTNPNIKQMQAEINALNSQLAQIKVVNSQNDFTVGRAVSTSSALFKFERELMIQRTLYDSYLKFLQGTAVEDLTSSANVRVLEPPYLDTERQYWWPGVAVLLGLVLIWGAIEFYRMRPPVGAAAFRREGSSAPA